jgi:opacity protein-like surface antigen
MSFSRTEKGMHFAMRLMGSLLALASTEVNAGTMGAEVLSAPGKIYFGVFGGGGSNNNFRVSQYGTAFYVEAAGGPLAVNAFGRVHGDSTGLVGGHVGYQWTNISPNFFNSPWSLSPAIELEGYYLGENTFTGHDINNNTTRLPEHDFLVKYPTSTGVFLVNALLNLNSSSSKFHPYLGGGIGSAVLSISGAKALQVAPAEPGVNHFNSNSSNSDSAFAAQGKVGFSFDLTSNFSVFAEYRGLYIADTSYSFGSTVYPGHPATSNWRIEMDSQYYNLGAVGIHYTV